MLAQQVMAKVSSDILNLIKLFGDWTPMASGQDGMPGVRGIRAGHPRGLDAGGGEDKGGDLDGALSDLGKVEIGRRWVA